MAGAATFATMPGAQTRDASHSANSQHSASFRPSSISIMSYTAAPQAALGSVPVAALQDAVASIKAAATVLESGLETGLSTAAPLPPIEGDVTGPTPPLPLCFKVQRFKFNRIKSIEQVAESWLAEVFLELRIEKGATYPDLVQNGLAPRMVDGRPIFGAEWFLGQIQYANSLHMDVLEAKTIRNGDDLLLVHRSDVTFSGRFDLRTFPFDTQGLSAELTIMCAKEGPLACELIMPTDSGPLADDGHGADASALSNVTVDAFLAGTSYELLQGLTAVAGCQESRTTERKTYPMLTFSCYVRRRPAYAIWNVAVPITVLALLSAASFVVPRAERDVAVPLSLLLTIVAYKFSINYMLPAVPYLTLLDKLILMTGLFVVLVVLEQLFASTHGHSSLADEVDMWCAWALLLSYVLWMGFFAIRVCIVSRRGHAGAHSSGHGSDRHPLSQKRSAHQHRSGPAAGALAEQKAHARLVEGGPQLAGRL